MITLPTLQRICRYASTSRLNTFVGPLNTACSRFDIVNPRREAAFLAQCAHESMEFLYLREIASGEAYEPPSVLAASLGNTQPGDGRKYKGLGLIQVTGKENITAAGVAIGVDLRNDPTLGEDPENGTLISAWFWRTHGLNELADANAFGTITHRINGGYTKMDQRCDYWLRSLGACGVTL